MGNSLRYIFTPDFSFAAIHLSPTCLCLFPCGFPNLQSFSPSHIYANPQNNLWDLRQPQPFKKATWNDPSPRRVLPNLHHRAPRALHQWLHIDQDFLEFFLQVLLETGMSLRMVFMLYNFMSFAILSRVPVIGKYSLNTSWRCLHISESWKLEEKVEEFVARGSHEAPLNILYLQCCQHTRLLLLFYI